MTQSPDEFLDGEPTESEKQAARQALRGAQTLADLRAKVRALSDDLKGAEARADALLALSESAGSSTPHRISFSRKKGGKEESNTNLATVALASDWHVEERVDPAQVNGRNEYTLDIAEQRMDYYWRSVVKLILAQTETANVRHHVQWIGGDLFTGSIHEELIETTQLTVMEAMLWLKPRLEAGLEYLLEACEGMGINVTVVWSYGNHGRDGRKPRISNAATHNYEWLLGQWLAVSDLGQRFERFIAESGYHTILDLDGYKMRFHHGDAVRGGGGIGGLTIPLRKKTFRWNQAEDVDLDVFGHFHQAKDFGYAVGNGSLIGWNAFANHIGAEYEPPMQAFFTVDLDRRMKAGFWPVWVEDPS